MPRTIKMDELKNLIVSKIREEGLSSKFDSDDLKEIEKSVKEFYRSKSGGVEENISEEYKDNKFPYQVDNNNPANIDQINPVQQPYSGETTHKIEEPKEISHPIDIPYEPVINNSVENIPIIPRPLQEKDCPKLVVSDYNELSHGGESLASKTFRTMENLDIRKSAGELWENDACVESDVYIMKFEKLGKIKYNFTNNTAVFEEQKFDIEPEIDVQNMANQQENPYQGKLNNLENIVKNSVDLEKVLTNVVKDILRNSLQDDSNLDLQK